MKDSAALSAVVLLLLMGLFLVFGSPFRAALVRSVTAPIAAQPIQPYP